MAPADHRESRRVDGSGSRLVENQREHPASDPAEPGPGSWRQGSCGRQRQHAGQDDQRGLAEQHQHGLDRGQDDRDNAEDQHHAGRRPGQREQRGEPRAELAAGGYLQHPRGPGITGLQQHRREQHPHRGRGRDDRQTGTDVHQRVRLAGDRHLPGGSDHREHGHRDGDRQQPPLQRADRRLAGQVRGRDLDPPVDCSGRPSSPRRTESRRQSPRSPRRLRRRPGDRRPRARRCRLALSGSGKASPATPTPLGSGIPRPPGRPGAAAAGGAADPPGAPTRPAARPSRPAGPGRAQSRAGRRACSAPHGRAG